MTLPVTTSVSMTTGVSQMQTIEADRDSSEFVVKREDTKAYRHGWQVQTVQTVQTAVY